MTQDDGVFYIAERQAKVYEAYKSLKEQGEEPTNKRLCEMTGEGERSVIKQLLELKAQGLIEAPSREMSPKERDMFELLKKFIQDEGYPPSLKDIGVELNRSTSAIREILLSLKAKGYITWKPGSARTIQILKFTVPGSSK